MNQTKTAYPLCWPAHKQRTRPPKEAQMESETPEGAKVPCSDLLAPALPADEHFALTFGEIDPNGLSRSTPGAKLDAGKIRAGLCFTGFARALREVAAVTTFGAAKYTPNGWRSVPDGEARYLDALHRHLLASANEAADADSGIDHMAHAAWNALAILELRLSRANVGNEGRGPQG